MTAWLVAALPLGGGVMTEIAAPGTLARTLGQGLGPAAPGRVGRRSTPSGCSRIRRIGRVEP